MMRLPGDSSIEIWADTPVFAEGLGSYYVKLDFVFGSSGIAQTERQEYDMKVPLTGGEPYLYTAQQPILFFTAPGKNVWRENPLFLQFRENS